MVDDGVEGDTGEIVDDSIRGRLDGECIGIGVI